MFEGEQAPDLSPPGERLRRVGPGRLRGARRGRARSAPCGSHASAGVPYFGICFGMQMAVIEAARNLGGVSRRRARRSSAPRREPVVGLMTEWARGKHAARYEVTTLILAARCAWAPTTPALTARLTRGGDLRLGHAISERHRHRYEVNIAYRESGRGRGPALFRPLSGRRSAGDRGAR